MDAQASHADFTPLEERALDAARSVRFSAHAPYSRFRVGAAVWTEDGQMFTGCNVESASFGLTLCAERSAIAAYVAATQGETRSPIVGVAIVADSEQPTPPCGACRQWLAEWAPGGVVIAEGVAADDVLGGGGGGGGGQPPRDGTDGAPGAFQASATLPRRRWLVGALIPEAFRGESLER